MKKTILNGILISLAMILSYMERLFPVALFIPLPGIKLGLANIVTLFALFYLNIPSAVAINIIRCILVALLFGNITSLLFSVFGALSALLVMALLKPGYGKYFSLMGISMAGAAAHNVGQMIAASIILKDTGIFSYLTILLIGSIFTGLLTAIVASNLFAHINKLNFLEIE